MSWFAINTVVLSGTVVRDPDMKVTQSGMAILSFSLAHNTQRKVGTEWKDEAHYFDCTAFGKMAEHLAKKLCKGTKLILSGDLRQEIPEPRHAVA